MSTSEILIVENEPVIAGLIQKSLESVGYAVPAIAASGEDAILKTAHHLPHLILMDINLEGDIDGVETAERIRNRFHIPVIFLTGSDDDALLERAKITEPFGFLLKPFSTNELKAAIEVALYKHKMEEELREHRDHLEELVIERTARLTIVNDQLQDELAHRNQVLEEQKKLAAMKEEFLQTVSHELRTPLTSIIGYLELLMAQSAGPLNEAQEKMLQTMMGNSDILLDLINDLLDLSKLQKGELPVAITPVRVIAEIARVMESFNQEAKNKNIILAFNPQASEISIVSDKEKIQRVVSNLVSNAIKFTEAGEVAVAVHSSDTGVRITVQDTGVGIPEDANDYIFEKFRQVDNTASRKVDGTGLGLAITKSLVDLLGGTIELESQVGKGSAFTVEIPSR